MELNSSWEMRMYIGWISEYLEVCREFNLSEEQMMKLVERYRAPVSEDDYMMLIYAHDDIDSLFQRDAKSVFDLDIDLDAHYKKYWEDK